MRYLGLLLVLAGGLFLAYEGFFAPGAGAAPAAPRPDRAGAAGIDPEVVFGGIAVTAGLILMAVNGRSGNKGGGDGGRQALPA